MDYEKGEVVLVPFHFADLTPAKQRPALIISSKSYNKKHAEDDDAGNRYAYKLENRAWELVNMIVSGQALLYDASLLISDLIDPKFWPDDTTGAVAIYDALGFAIAPAGSEDIKFRMGSSF